MHLAHLVQVGLGEVFRGGGVRDEEGVVGISSRMLLRLKLEMNQTYFSCKKGDVFEAKTSGFMY